MSQAPREYKFVGPFSRKRRRRDGTAGSTNPTSRTVVAPTPQIDINVAAAGHSPSSDVHDRGHSDKERPTNLIPPVEVRTTEISPTFATPSLDRPDTVLIDNVNALHDTIADLSNNDNVNGSYSAFMNPFLDLDPSFVTPFARISQDHQSHVNLGPNIPPLRLEDTSSVNGSAQDDATRSSVHVRGNTGNVQRAISDETILPSLISLESPGNLSLTITQLLTRCTSRACRLIIRLISNWR